MVVRPGTAARPVAQRRPHVVAVVGLAAATASALAGRPLAWMLLTVATVAAARAGLRGGVERLPVSAVVVVAGLGSVALGAGLLGVDVMSSPWPGRLLLVVLVVGLVVGAHVVTRGSPRAATLSRVELVISTLPAGVMALLWIVIAASPLGAATSWFLSADHLRHLALVTRTVDAGALEYDTQSYPRGWHAALALLWSSAGSERDADGLAELVRLQSLATWLVLVLVALAVALVAAELHRRRGGGPLASAAAGGVVGSLVVGPAFFGDYVPRGFQTSLLALLVLAACVLRMTRRCDDPGALVVAGVSVMLLAHVWQVLLPVAGLLLVMVLHARWGARPSGRRVVGDMLFVGAVGAVAAQGLMGAVRGYGLDAIAVPGDVPAAPIGWLLAVVVSGVALATAGTRAPLSPVVVAAGASFATAVGLMLVSGVGWDSYYPNKTLWTAAALGLPLLGAAGAQLLSAAARGPGGRVVVAGFGAVVVGVALLCLMAPVMGVRGSWSAADGDVVMDTVTSSAAADATVVWAVGTGVDDATSQLLLDFYSAEATSPPLGLAARSVDDQCRLLAAAASPVVLSGADESVVRSRFACVPGLRVTRPEGAP